MNIPTGITHHRVRATSHGGGYRDAATPRELPPLRLTYDAPRTAFTVEALLTMIGVALCAYAAMSGTYALALAAPLFWAFTFWRVQTPASQTQLELDADALRVTSSRGPALRDIQTRELLRAEVFFSTQPGPNWACGVRSRAHEGPVHLLTVADEGAANYIQRAINVWLEQHRGADAPE